MFLQKHHDVVSRFLLEYDAQTARAFALGVDCFPAAGACGWARC